jgi:hypothetical protein
VKSKFGRSGLEPIDAGENIKMSSKYSHKEE